jgi:hypothetical protein
MEDNSLEIYKTLSASTCHVDQNDIAELEYNNASFTTYDGYYNTRLVIHESILDDLSQINFSEGLRLLVLFAVSNGCAYLDLDSDGPVYNNFPTYDW